MQAQPKINNSTDALDYINKVLTNKPAKLTLDNGSMQYDASCTTAKHTEAEMQLALALLNFYRTNQTSLAAANPKFFADATGTLLCLLTMLARDHQRNNN